VKKNAEEVELYLQRISEMNLPAVNCRMEAQECDWATSFLPQIPWVEVDQ